MNRKQYMNALKRELRGLNAEDRKTILDDYDEHFRQSLAEGQSEDSIAAALGTPAALAAEAKEERGIEKCRESTAGSVVRISMASLSLLLFNAIVIIGPYAGLLAVVVSLWATAVSVTVSGAAMILSVPLEPLLRIWLPIEPVAGVMPRVAIFFGGISVSALGLLACIGMIYLTKWFIDGTVRYAKMTWRIATR